VITAYKAVKSILTESMAADSGLHDYEVVSFGVDYSDCRIEMCLRSTRGCDAILYPSSFSPKKIKNAVFRA
jgi:hypothetical protein